MSDFTNPAHLVLRSTYGVLESLDGGATWSWICESSVGYGLQYDPAIGVIAGGTIIAALPNGLSSTRDFGCGWQLASGPLSMEAVVDVAVYPPDPRRAVAITSTPLTGRYHTFVAETADGGQSWSQAGTALPDDLVALTVEVAPSRPSRVYVSGLVARTGESVLERSDDRGLTWTRIPVSWPSRPSAFISAIDPRDPDRLYVRLNDNRLVMSRDGGTSWVEAYAGMGSLQGFALSTDGSTIAVGGPRDGIWTAPTRTMRFEKVSAVGAGCLMWNRTGLYACAAEVVDGFTVGLSQDGGRSFQPLYRLSSLCPLQCPAGTTTQGRCPAAWPSVQRIIQQPAGACGGGLSRIDGGAAIEAGNGGDPTDGRHLGGGGSAGGGSDRTRGGGQCGCVRASNDSSFERWGFFILLLWISGSRCSATNRREGNGRSRRR